ncbi:hypothetical protein LOTGIDRAFT_158678 [Lottia gigantea]|uniref:Cholesterol side-chain cleavage enzyme, mitochondrial n=1 Tax=Lottia gigantea TaxID=225164 RepID=V4CAA1_LOTGI|nr:hypothetical protein LOTGIDRAFT_158678 [Lottia gigantea]ESO98729.1 hypothetical protein LOTGIDRAFT_158678 [Lottia gigantea]
MARVLMGYEDKRHEDETVNDFTSIIETARENFKDAKILLSTPKCLWSLTKAWPRHSGRWDKLLSITGRYINKYTKDASLEYENDDTCVLSELLKSGELTGPEAHINITDLILASIDTELALLEYLIILAFVARQFQTSSTILWCVYELSRSKEIQDKLFQEIDEFLNINKDLSFAGLQNLPYLRGIIRESQRLHPVGFFMSRMIQEPSTIRGYHIQKGSHVAGSMYVMGRDPDMFPEPETFHPERWFGDNPDLETFINNVPFGFGRRMCIGRRVADLVISCFIFNLERYYTISQITDRVIEPTFRLLMVPGEPIQIRLQSR